MDLPTNNNLSSNTNGNLKGVKDDKSGTSRSVPTSLKNSGISSKSDGELTSSASNIRPAPFRAKTNTQLAPTNSKNTKTLTSSALKTSPETNRTESTNLNAPTNSKNTNSLTGSTSNISTASIRLKSYNQTANSTSNNTKALNSSKTNVLQIPAKPSRATAIPITNKSIKKIGSTNSTTNDQVIQLTEMAVSLIKDKDSEFPDSRNKSRSDQHSHHQFAIGAPIAYRNNNNNIDLVENAESSLGYFLEEFNKLKVKDDHPLIRERFEKNTAILEGLGYDTKDKVAGLINDMYLHDLYIYSTSKLFKQSLTGGVNFLANYDPKLIGAKDDDNLTKIAWLISSALALADIPANLLTAKFDSKIYHIVDDYAVEKVKGLRVPQVEVMIAQANSAFWTSFLKNGTRIPAQFLIAAIQQSTIMKTGKNQASGRIDNALDSFLPLLYTSAGFFNKYYESSAYSPTYASSLGLLDPKDFQDVIEKATKTSKIDYRGLLKKIGIKVGKDVGNAAVGLICIGWVINNVIHTNASTHEEGRVEYQNMHNVTLDKDDVPLGSYVYTRANSTVMIALMSVLIGVATSKASKIPEASTAIVVQLKNYIASKYRQCFPNSDS
jgi:hypothetical protein